jgi:hypothetical protein
VQPEPPRPFSIVKRPATITSRALVVLFVVDPATARVALAGGLPACPERDPAPAGSARGAAPGPGSCAP